MAQVVEMVPSPLPILSQPPLSIREAEPVLAGEGTECGEQQATLPQSRIAGVLGTGAQKMSCCLRRGLAGGFRWLLRLASQPATGLRSPNFCGVPAVTLRSIY